MTFVDACVFHGAGVIWVRYFDGTPGHVDTAVANGAITVATGRYEGQICSVHKYEKIVGRAGVKKGKRALLAAKTEAEALYEWLRAGITESEIALELLK